MAVAVAVFFGALLLYSVTQPTLLSWESYLYPLALDGVVHLGRDILSLHQPEPDWSRTDYWHPSHPGLHVLALWVKLLFAKIGVDADSILIFSWLNRISGAIIAALGSWMIYSRTAKHLHGLLAGALVLASSGYWMWSMSGEVHLPSIALLAISFTLLFRDQLGHPTAATRQQLITFPQLYLISILFAVAVVFHLRSAPFGLVILYGVLRRGTSWRLSITRVLLFLLIATLAFVGAYILPTVVLYQEFDIASWMNRIVVYSAYGDRMMANRLEIFLADLFTIAQTVWYGVFYGLRSTVVHQLFAAIAVGGLVFLVWRATQQNRNASGIWTGALIWFATYFVFDWLVVPTSYVQSYKTFFIFPLLLGVYGGILTLSPRNALVFALLAVVSVSTWNWLSAFRYKTQLPLARGYLSSQVEIPEGTENVIVVANENWLIAEAWFLHQHSDGAQVNLLPVTSPNSIPDIPNALKKSSGQHVLVLSPGLFNPDHGIQQAYGEAWEFSLLRPVEARIYNPEQSFAQFRAGPARTFMTTRRLLVYKIERKPGVLKPESRLTPG